MEEELRKLKEEAVRIARKYLQVTLQFLILAAVSIITAVLGIEMKKVVAMWVAILEMLILIPYWCVTIYTMYKLRKEQTVLLSRIRELLEKESIE